MKRKYLSLIFTLFLLFSIEAKPSYMTDINIGYSLDTNIYSDPLPQYNSSCDWLEWKSEHPLEKHHSFAFNMAFNMFFKEESRVGISTSLQMNIPLHSTTITPVADTELGFIDKWHYEEHSYRDPSKISLYAGLGAIFIARLDWINIGTSIRLSLGTYDFTDKSVVLGFHTEPFIQIPITQSMLFNFKFTYDSHIIKFINDKNMIYEPNYQMLTISPSLGISFTF